MKWDGRMNGSEASSCELDNKYFGPVKDRTLLDQLTDVDFSRKAVGVLPRHVSHVCA
jgi:hypothetical protein